MGNLLQIRNLTIHYRSNETSANAAVDNVSFDIAMGETVGLMGQSGCGKSSLALALLGLIPNGCAEISGSALIAGHELMGMPEAALEKIRGEQISIVFQEPEIALSPVMRVGQQVTEVIHAHENATWNECGAKAAEMLARVGLDGGKRIFSAYPHELSGGQRQRVALAQALACNPTLLIADEPTASLDARSQAGFLELLRQVKRESNLSILLISHTPEIQASLADRLMVMRAGRIIEQGRFEDVYSNPAQEYSRTLLRHAEAIIHVSDVKNVSQAQLVR